MRKGGFLLSLLLFTAVHAMPPRPQEEPRGQGSRALLERFERAAPLEKGFDPAWVAGVAGSMDLFAKVRENLGGKCEAYPRPLVPLSEYISSYMEFGSSLPVRYVETDEEEERSFLKLFCAHSRERTVQAFTQLAGPALDFVGTDEAPPPVEALVGVVEIFLRLRHEALGEYRSIWGDAPSWVRGLCLTELSFLSHVIREHLTVLEPYVGRAPFETLLRHAPALWEFLRGGDLPDPAGTAAEQDWALWAHFKEGKTLSREVTLPSGRKKVLTPHLELPSVLPAFLGGPVPPEPTLAPPPVGKKKKAKKKKPLPEGLPAASTPEPPLVRMPEPPPVVALLPGPPLEPRPIRPVVAPPEPPRLPHHVRVAEQFFDSLFSHEPISWKSLIQFWGAVGGTVRGEKHGGSHRTLYTRDGRFFTSIFVPHGPRASDLDGNYGPETCARLRRAFLRCGEAESLRDQEAQRAAVLGAFLGP